MKTALLEGRWGETKDALLEGLQGTKRSTMSVVLENTKGALLNDCLLYTSPSPRDQRGSRMPSSA